jgi:hypothetical protein
VSPVGEPLSVDVDRDLRFRGGFPSDEEEDSPSDEECEEDGRSCSLGVREGDLPLCREEREVERPDLLEERECLEEERACRFEEWEDSCRCSDWVLWCEEEFSPRVFHREHRGLHVALLLLLLLLFLGHDSVFSYSSNLTQSGTLFHFPSTLRVIQAHFKLVASGVECVCILFGACCPAGVAQSAKAQYSTRSTTYSFPSRERREGREFDPGRNRQGHNPPGVKGRNKHQRECIRILHRSQRV